METKHLHWNSQTGNVFAWVVQDGEIIKAAGVPGMTLEEVEKLAQEEGVQLEII